LGRSDDMLIVRGVNIFPSSVESIIREQVPHGEYRVTVTRCEEMDQLNIEIETDPDTSSRLAASLRERLAMRVETRTVATDSLPRFEAKARRWIDRRTIE
ncbi:MAG: phenylacetate--CoA ligase family protein, partial [Planctomycetota bacterium]